MGTRDKPTVEIEITSDTICPWCYIGKKRLEKALDLLKEAFTFKVIWKPYILRPQIPAEGVDVNLFLGLIFSDKQKYLKYLQRAGDKEDIKWVIADKVPNSLQSHRLIKFAGEQDKQNEVVELLFYNYWEKGRDIGESDVLIEIGNQAGLTGVKEYLMSSKDAEEITIQDCKAKDEAIAGVPYFVFNKRHRLSGAQDPFTFITVIQKFRDQSAKL